MVEHEFEPDEEETWGDRLRIGAIAAAVVLAGFGAWGLIEGRFHRDAALLVAGTAFVCFAFLGREWWSVLSHGPPRHRL